MLQTASIKGDFPSLKLGRMVRYSSTIERDYLFFLEYWPHVTWYREQPMKIELPMPDGRLRSYTPDYEVHSKLGKTLVECKPAARLTADHTEQQCYLGQRWAEMNGYLFQIVTDIDLRTGGRLTTLRLLWRYARYDAREWQAQILAFARKRTTFTVDAVCQELDLSAGSAFATVCYLLFHHHVCTDLNQPFTSDAPLWIQQEVA